MKKVLAVAIVAGILSVICSVTMQGNVLAIDKEKYCSGMDSLGKVLLDEKIVINGQEQPLLCVFEDRDSAMIALKEQIPTILNLISHERALPELDSSNYELYERAAFSFPAEEHQTELMLLLGFLDIYENDDVNRELVDYVGMHKGNIDNIFDEEILSRLPDYAPLVREYQANRQLENKYFSQTPSTRLSANARTYAIIYAENPNTQDYSALSADCTNFVSQILHAGGVPQQQNVSPFSGWWHRKVGWTHLYSRSWTWTPSFANYMSYTEHTNHASFFSDLHELDIILADTQPDGNWNHAGFVTWKESNRYKVAQHTKNYYKWTTEPGNNWPSMPRFGIVRK